MSAIAITIDVEGVHGDHPIADFIYGTSNRSFPRTGGVLAIADELAERDMAGVFFVDVYERHLFGDAPMGRLVEALLERNQDVQLHTHPSWRDDDRDPEWLRAKKAHLREQSGHEPLLADNDDAALEAIIGEGVEFLSRLTGRPVLGHRGGGYSIDDRSISALERAGVRLDSSVNPIHANSRSTAPLNRMSKIGDAMVELPIYVMDLRLANRCRRVNVALETAPADIDVASMLPSERRGLRGHVMMHSYSLVRPSLRLRSPKPSSERRTLLRRLLDLCVSEGIPTASTAELLELATDEWIADQVADEALVPTGRASAATAIASARARSTARLSRLIDVR